MPLIKIQTNANLSNEKANELLAALSQNASEWLDKPEAYVQVMIESTHAMMFAGTNDPTAFIEVRSLGFYGHSIGEIAQALCTFIHDELAIPQDRIFINFFDIDRKNWGWNGKTFG